MVSYAWNWGDGSPPQTSDSPTITHVFIDKPNLSCVDAIYAVQLTVTDDKGSNSSTNEQVTVVESPPPGSAACQ